MSGGDRLHSTHEANKHYLRIQLLFTLEETKWVKIPKRNQSVSLSVFFLTTFPWIHGPVVRFRLNCNLKDLLLKAIHKRYADLSSTSTPMRFRQISPHKSLLSCLILSWESRPNFFFSTHRFPWIQGWVSREKFLFQSMLWMGAHFSISVHFFYIYQLFWKKG